MKKKLFLVFWGLIVCGVFLEAQTLDEAILRAALKIGADLPADATAAVIHFRADTETLTDYVINELHGAILRNRRITPVKPDERQLQSIRDELRFNATGEIDKESARSIGRLLKAQYLITGSMERAGSGYEILFTAVDTESAEIRSRYAASVNPDTSPPPPPVDPTWKNKWVYLGGMVGGGFQEYHDRDEKFLSSREGEGGLFAAGFVSEFALLPFFSIELDLVPAFGEYIFLPMMPILAKLGYRFAQIELSFDIGYTLFFNFTLGGTFGGHVGPGILFVKMLCLPELSQWSDASVWIWSAGYKIGLRDKKKRLPKMPQADTNE